MAPLYPQSLAWSDYPRIGIDEFLRRFPEVVEELEDEDEFQDYQSHLSIILLTGDAYISQARLDELKEEYSVAIAVDGNLHIDGFASKLLYVRGDLYCGSIGLNHSKHSPAGGRVIARHYVGIQAEDDCVMRDAPTARIETPYLFSWFYEIGNLDISPETVIFILGNWDYCANIALPNVVFSWYECVYALQDDYAAPIGFDGHDAEPWSGGVFSALRAGKNIFRSGFDLACIEHQKAGDSAMILKDYRTAYLAYKRSALVSPAYYSAWFGMAEALYEVAAYEQALHHYQEAATRFPVKQTGLLNGAANDAALCAIRCRQLPLAVAWASRSIAHNQDLAEVDFVSYRRPCANAYRFRAEAHLLSGNEQAAFQDLEAALALNSDHITANWLMGLVYFHRGDAKKAKKHHKLASDANADFAVYYDQATNTDFLAKTATHVEWDQLDAMAFGPPVKDEAYWREFLRHSDPIKIKQVPRALRSTALCLEVAANAPQQDNGFASHIPAASFTRELAEALVRRSAANLRYVPKALIDKSLCMLAPLEPGGFRVEDVPVEILDSELCLHMVQRDAYVDELPVGLIEKALCVASVRLSAYRIEHVPAEFRDDALYVEAIAYGKPYFFDHHVPSRYKTPVMLKQAISLGKQALDAIPGHCFDADLYAHAQALYEQDPDWPGIVERHSQEACRQNGDCAEVCWSAFWDEPFLLEQIKLDSHQYHALSAYEIPEKFFTQAIAEAFAECEPIHLDSIPKRFVTQPMCDRFSLEYPDMLERVPVAFRTEAICKKAVKKKVQNLRLVPLALRSVGLCVTALLEDGDLADEIPLALESQVFDRLIKRHSEDFYQGWLYNKRGDGYLGLNPPLIDKALADYQTVVNAQDTEEFTESQVQDALYSIGYCHYLRGDLEEAERWRTKADTANDLVGYGEYDERGFGEPSEVFDFEKKHFDSRMGETEEFMRACDFQNAYLSVQQAEKMLLEANSKDRFLWAHVLDKKRYVSFELELWNVNEETCREAIERLERESLWAYDKSDDAVRHTLRSCYFGLGAMRLGEDLTLQELEADAGWIKKAFDSVGPTEDKSVLYPFYEAYAELLLVIAQQDSVRRAACNKLLADIRTLRLVEKGFVKSDEVLQALAT